MRRGESSTDSVVGGQGPGCSDRGEAGRPAGSAPGQGGKQACAACGALSQGFSLSCRLVEPSTFVRPRAALCTPSARLAPLPGLWGVQGALTLLPASVGWRWGLRLCASHVVVSEGLRWLPALLLDPHPRPVTATCSQHPSCPCGVGLSSPAKPGVAPATGVGVSGRCPKGPVSGNTSGRHCPSSALCPCPE